ARHSRGDHAARPLRASGGARGARCRIVRRELPRAGELMRSSEGAASRISVVSATLLIARKDLAIEFRTRTAFFSAVIFALLGIVIFYFAWDPTAVAAIDLAPGVLWVI